MNQLIEQMQQAYEREGRKGARQAFLTAAEERDWTREELDEAVQLLRGFPKSL
jgi:hypothetical protein